MGVHSAAAAPGLRWLQGSAVDVPAERGQGIILVTHATVPCVPSAAAPAGGAAVHAAPGTIPIARAGVIPAVAKSIGEQTA